MKRLSTRLLLSVAAIAVVCGVILVASGPLHVIFSASVPWAYGILVALYFLPAAISLPLYKTPGIALITATLTGLIVSVSPGNPIGFKALMYVIVIGILQELPVALTGYRVWKTWIYFIGAVISGVILAIGFYFAFHISALRPIMQLVQIATTVLGPILVTAIGLAIGTALKKALAIADPKSATAEADKKTAK